MNSGTLSALRRFTYSHFYDLATCRPRDWREYERLSQWGPTLLDRLAQVAMTGEDLTDESRAMIRAGLTDEEAPEFVARVIFAAHLYTFRPLAIEDRATIERMKVIARQFVPTYIRKLMCGRPLNIPSLAEEAASIEGRLTIPEMLDRLKVSGLVPMPGDRLYAAPDGLQGVPDDLRAGEGVAFA